MSTRKNTKNLLSLKVYYTTSCQVCVVLIIFINVKGFRFKHFERDRLSYFIFETPKNEILKSAVCYASVRTSGAFVEKIMNVYQVRADCDWGNITDRATVEATTFHTAFHRAGKMAVRLARKRPKWIMIRVEKIGKKVTLQEKSDKAMDFISKAFNQETQ